VSDGHTIVPAPDRQGQSITVRGQVQANQAFFETRRDRLAVLLGAS
jgi:hypothetical protein